MHIVGAVSAATGAGCRYCHILPRKRIFDTIAEDVHETHWPMYLVFVMLTERKLPVQHKIASSVDAAAIMAILLWQQSTRRLPVAVKVLVEKRCSRSNYSRALERMG